MSSELKAYACLEPYENTGAIIFAKSNIEARRRSADEFHDGDISGMSVKRAPWADKYGARQNVPIWDMVWHGWHFECCWSGIRIDEDLYYEYEGYSLDEEDEDGNELFYKSFVGKKPVGYQEGLCFASQEYADNWEEYKRIEKEFHEEQLKYYRGIVLKNLPDAVLMDDERYYQCNEHISSRDMKTDNFQGLGPRRLYEVYIPIDFPNRKHWAALEFRQPEYGKYGPTKPVFVCANGDLEVFEKWAAEQKVKKNG